MGVDEMNNNLDPTSPLTLSAIVGMCLMMDIYASLNLHRMSLMCLILGQPLAFSNAVMVTGPPLMRTLHYCKGINNNLINEMLC